MAPLPQQSTRATLPGTINQKRSLSSITRPLDSGPSLAMPSLTGGGEWSRARAMFDRYDSDGSGAISTQEFRNLCYDLGYFLSDKELALDVKMLDVDGDGEISFDEFIKWWQKDDRFKSLQVSAQEYETLESYLTHFQRFDKDGSGIIDIREFKALYIDLVKKKMATKSLMGTLQDLDVNKDGRVSFNEYVNWALSLSKQRGI